MRIDILTLFPEMFGSFLGTSIPKRAAEKGLVEYKLTNFRDFATDAHQSVDDKPFGGGPGMVMKPEPLFAAVESVRTPDARVLLMCPQGRPFDQALARELSAASHLVFVCGHYEGIDERVRTHLVTDEVSIGDYVLTNGVLPAAVVIDAVVRLLPGVVGAEGRFGAGHVVLRAAPPGTGIIAGGPMRAVFEALGIADVVAKSIGSSNPHNMIKATFDALTTVASPRSVAARRGKKVGDIVGRREGAGDARADA